MDSYCELKALPNPEIIQSTVMAELMKVLHPLLVKFEGRVGLDFPCYRAKQTLGGIIRLLGLKQDIEALHKLLEENMTVQDYALLTQLENIPTGIRLFASCQRRHARGNSRFQRLKKRHQERGTWTEELEQAVLAKFSEPLNLPYLTMNSASTAQQFLLFIERGLSSKSKTGLFNSYGLGLNGATVPIF